MHRILQMICGQITSRRYSFNLFLYQGVSSGRESIHGGSVVQTDRHRSNAMPTAVGSEESD